MNNNEEFFDPYGINYYPQVLTPEINTQLHKIVLGHSRWTIVTDNLPIETFQQIYNGCDAGSIICSYRNKNSKSIKIESEYKYEDNFVDKQMQDLNFYAELIQSIILNRSLIKKDHVIYPYFKNVEVIRYFWNYYHSNSIGIKHTDINESNHWSIIYYLNDNPGTGTIICPEKNINDLNNSINSEESEEEILCPQIAGNAILFPSHWVHAGKSPVGNTHRCCLNILFKADTND